MSLKNFKDSLSFLAYGMTRDEAVGRNICVGCKKPMHQLPPLEKIEDVREYRISGLCPACFKEACGPEE